MFLRFWAVIRKLVNYASGGVPVLSTSTEINKPIDNHQLKSRRVLYRLPHLPCGREKPKKCRLKFGVLSFDRISSLLNLANKKYEENWLWCRKLKNDGFSFIKTKLQSSDGDNDCGGHRQKSTKMMYVASVIQTAETNFVN